MIHPQVAMDMLREVEGIKCWGYFLRPFQLLQISCVSTVTIYDSQHWIIYIWFGVNQLWSKPLTTKSNFIHPRTLHVKTYQEGHNQSTVVSLLCLVKITEVHKTADALWFLSADTNLPNFAESYRSLFCYSGGDNPNSYLIHVKNAVELEMLRIKLVLQ